MTMKGKDMQVKINDPQNWYHGRVGKIVNTEIFGDVVIHTVHVPSNTGNAVISGAYRDEKLVKVG